jgi:uncharacterized RDD family membrane protein YckC
VEYEDHRTIATPEGIELDLPLAGLASRFSAFLLDSFLVALLVAALVVLAAALLSGTAALVLVGVAFSLAILGYDVLFEVLGGGRTPGKRAASLRVVRDGGRPVNLRASLVRNVIRLVEGLPLLYVPAIVSILSTRNNQRLGDLAAGTLVIREPRRPPPAPPLPEPVDPSAYASWDVAGVGDRELAAVRAFLGRREQLDPGARRALCRQLAAALRPRVAGVPAGLDDERFLERLAAAKAARA